VIALHQISDDQVLVVEWVTPALTQSVPEARQNSRTRSGTVSSVAIASVFGGLATIKAAYQYIATTGQLESRWQKVRFVRVNACDALLNKWTDAAERTSLNQRRSSCFARSASLSSRPQLAAQPLSLRRRHRPGDAAAASADSMADFMRAGAIGVSATVAGRGGAISIRTAASVLSDVNL
jgi:predicted component of type VI protein secretion system